MLFTVAMALAAPPNLLVPAPSGAAAPDDAAVVVGIETYGFLPDVPHAARDAAAVRSLMLDTVGVPAERIHLLTSANREQLLAAVDAASAEVGEAGRLWLWFSGHGATSPVDGSLLLVGDDAKPQPDVFAARSVSMAQLRERLDVPALVVADACAAGRGRDGAELVPGTRFAVPTWVDPDPGAARPELVVWSAAGPTQLAEPYPAARHGLFTYFAVGALRGWADGAQGAADGQVTLPEAQAFVERALATVGATQRPELHGGDALAVPVAVEAGPDLGRLPPLRGVVGGVVGGVGPGSASDDEGPAFFPPFSHEGGGRFADSQGAAMSRAQLFGTVGETLEMAKAERAHDRNTLWMAGGLGLVGVAGVGAGITAMLHSLAVARYEAGASLCEETTTGFTTGLSSVCEDEPAPLAGKEAVWAGVGAVGVGLTIGGALGRRASQRRLAEAASEAASDQ